MIKIKLTDSKRKELEKHHWNCFKENYLKNWIKKIKEDDDFKICFFNSVESFNEWFDEKNGKNWIKNQDESKFEVFKKFVIEKPEYLIEKEKNTNQKINVYFKGQYYKFREEYATELIEKLDLRVCPYCNRNYVDNYEIKQSGKKKFTGQLDHFYPIEKYPYLALSLYNLIPCCSNCNHIKSDNKEEILYPYRDEYGNHAKFRTKFIKDKNGEISLDFLLGNSTEFEIVIDIKEAKYDIENLIKNSKDMFHIEERYNCDKNYVIELIRKSIVYNESRINELLEQYPELFEDRDDVLQMIVSNYICDDELDKRPLAKLTKDICEEFGLLECK